MTNIKEGKSINDELHWVLIVDIKWITTLRKCVGTWSWKCSFWYLWHPLSPMLINGGHVKNRYTIKTCLFSSPMRTCQKPLGYAEVRTCWFNPSILFSWPLYLFTKVIQSVPAFEQAMMFSILLLLLPTLLKVNKCWCKKDLIRNHSQHIHLRQYFQSLL